MRSATLALVALLAILPLVQAQQPASPAQQPILIAGDVTWDQPQDLNNSVVVMPGGTLTIRATSVDFHNNTLQVLDGGRLVAQSVGSDAAILRGENGWTTKVYGELDLEGTPEAPVQLVGIGGLGSTRLLLSDGAASLSGGLAVSAGRLRATHAAFLNYTSGVIAGGNATRNGSVEMTDVEFNSPFGAGFLSSNTDVSIRDSRFVGQGGNAFFSLSLRPAEVSNLSFVNSTTGLAVRDATVNASHVSVTGSFACLLVQAGGWTHLRLDHFTCSNYTLFGVSVSHPKGTVKTTGEIQVTQAQLGSTAPHAGAVMRLGGDANLTLQDVSIGPTPPGTDGVELESRSDLLENVTFHDVGGYDVRVASPPSDPPTHPLGTGEPGALGWLRVVQPTVVHVVDARSGDLVDNVTVTIREAGNATPIYRNVASVAGASTTLDRLRIDRAGNVTAPRYDLDARTTDLQGNKTDYEATAPIVIVRLGAQAAGTPTPVSAPGHAVPLPGLLGVAALVLALAIRRRVS